MSANRRKNTQNFSLTKIIQSAAEHMTADLRQRLITHPGELGAGREEVFRSFLKKHLPARFMVSTGFIFDCHGSVSKQLDIIIADAGACPHFETAGGIKHFPCEAVLAVGQVKSSIPSTAALCDALENLESAKVLDRSADG